MGLLWLHGRVSAAEWASVRKPAQPATAPEGHYAQKGGDFANRFQPEQREVPDLKPLRVGIALSSLALEQAHQPDLFDKPSNARLVTAIDQLNAKFGKGAITYGAAAADQGSKIAFQRVPKVDEF